MKKRIGLIDFGSNTFHLLIASMSESTLDILFRQREYVFLAQSGIKIIEPEAMERGIEAVAKFHTICNHYEVDEIIAVGTAALRTAINSTSFTSVIEERFGILTQVIDGQREADLIYAGMSLACPSYKSDAVFMDIGGGSTEFILTDENDIVFRQSFPIGLGVLKNEIPLSDPLLSDQISKVNNFLDQEADPLVQIMRKHKPKTLIGGSGTFDVLAEALTGETFNTHDCSVISPEAVRSFINARLYDTLADRLADEAIPDKRVHLIIHAFLLILWTLDKHSFETIAFSRFALKEGLLQEYYKKEFK